ncbi:MAG: glycosyltransferase family 4 protein [Vicinamibacteraceae bacterium]
MHICLVSAEYPPRRVGGIARQRAVLAQALARLGHEVSVVCCADSPGLVEEDGVRVSSVAVSRIQHFSSAYLSLDALLTTSQALYEGVRAVDRRSPIDLVDVPLWGLQGFVTVERERWRSVVWVQTTWPEILRLARRRLQREDRARIDLERRTILRAGAVLADSRSVLEDLGVSHRVRGERLLSGVAHLGLPDVEVEAVPTPAAPPDDDVEAIVVGRLEQRKGIRELFKVLPGLLTRCPTLRVRFLGADNSEDDGWRAKTGHGYAEFFRSRHPLHADRVTFEGHVDDRTLEGAYARADLAIVPSLYESFGLVYLEAMRAGRPVVGFRTGGAGEIFPDGEMHGALLVPVGRGKALTAGIERLIGDLALRATLGARGRARFLEMFTVDRMAGAHVDFYAQVLSASARAPRSRSVRQVMEALDCADAVSDITRHHAATLADLGQPAPIVARFQAEGLEREVAPVSAVLRTPDVGLIFHYWGHNSTFWLPRAIDGPCVLYYHSVTPPDQYPEGSDGWHRALRALRQLQEGIDRFDLLIGDSRFNLHELAAHLRRPLPGLCIYPVVSEEWVDGETDQSRMLSLGETYHVNVLFVGRIARNKRQDRLMQTFDCYWRDINRHASLWLVGNELCEADYRRELATLQQSLESRDNIHFTGKVSDAELRGFYRQADVFLCASEHEGFCMPIAQAMAAGVPVIARAAAAVPETLGGTGFLIHDWQTRRVAEVIHLCAGGAPELRARLVAAERQSAERFSPAEARARLHAVLHWMETGQASGLFETMLPSRVDSYRDTAPISEATGQEQETT